LTLPPLLPRSLWLLFFLWPGVLVAGWALASRVTREGRLRALLAPGFAGCAWLVTTHLAGRALRSYTAAVIIGTALPGAVGYAFLLRQLLGRRLAASSSLPAPSRSSSWTAAFRQVFGRGYSRWMLITMVLVTALMAPAAWNWCFHDDAGATAHLALIFEMQRGIYPPRNLTFPQLEMPYHYGFDATAAYLSALLRVDPERGIDLLTLAAWAYAWCLFWGLGEELWGRRGGPLCAGLTLLGAGFPYYCASNFESSTTFSFHVLNGCFEGGNLLNPATFSYFFQHPWGLGVPLVGLIGVWLCASSLGSLFDVLVAALLLLALDISQFAAWSAAMPIVAATVVLAWRRGDHWRILAALATLGAIFLAARGLGGFWAHNQKNAFALQMHLGINRTLESTLMWNLRTYAALLVGLLGLPFLDRTNRPRVFFALVALGGISICNLFVYGRSWDIVKFATFGAIGFGVLASGVVARWQRSRRLLVRMGAVVVLVAAGLSAGGWFLVFDWNLNPGAISWALGCSPGMTGPDYDASKWLRSHMRAEDIVYRNEGVSAAYATYAGLGQVWLGNSTALPLPEELIRKRVDLMGALPAEPDRYREEGIRYFVLDGQDGRITGIVQAWETRGLAHERVRFGPLRIVEL